MLLIVGAGVACAQQAGAPACSQRPAAAVWRRGPAPGLQRSKAAPRLPAARLGQLQLPARWRPCCSAQGAGGEATTVTAGPASTARCLYDGVIFDMDGTLTISNIDFLDMRTRTGITSGDLFTVMESWDEGDRIKASMEVILELEAKACAALEAQPGLLEVLAHLRDAGVRVGLVTRNTEASVDAFFGLIGREWQPLFDPVLTREFRFVKPDKRALQHFAQAWGLPPARLLMVGDSTEDVETGNAAGTATCLIAGGGNELPAPGSGGGGGSDGGAVAVAPPAPPPGAVPSFTVHSLHELLERLQAADTPLGWNTSLSGSMDLSSSSGEWSSDGEEWGSLEPRGQDGGGAAPAASPARPGAPPPGIGFLDFLFLSGAVHGASCSFPRIIAPAPGDEHPGDRLLHFGSGDAALTKLLASSGLQVVAADTDPAPAAKRGLKAVGLPGPLGSDALLAALGPAESYNAVAVFTPLDQRQAGGVAAQWEQPEVLTALAALLRPGGRLCVEAWVEDPDQLRSRAHCKLPVGVASLDLGGGGAGAGRGTLRAPAEGRSMCCMLRLGGLGLEAAIWQELAEAPGGWRRVRFVALHA